MSLLPSSGSEVESTQNGDLRVYGVEQDELDTVFNALGPKMARDLLSAIYTDPGTPSELADQIDTSVQNVMYHLDKLETADLIHVADTRYSEKRKEMKVYAPTDSPLVVFVGTEQRKTSFLRHLKRLVTGLGILAILSVLFQRLFFGSLPYISYAADAGDAEPVVPFATAMFIGGVVMLVLISGWRYWQRF